MEIIRTYPGEASYSLFSDLPKRLYEESSPRFLLGNDPVEKHLEGCYVLTEGNEAVGRFSFYENPDLVYNESRTACIGSYECINDQAKSTRLIEHAKELSKRMGYSWLIGPMEGSTWNNYRFSNNNNHPNFFLEPYHHAYYNDQFVASGFEVLESYMTQLDTQLKYDPEKLEMWRHHFQEKGAIIRNLDKDNLEKEFRAIGRFSIEAFSHNTFYSPISVDEFVDKYMKIEKYIDPKMVWLVEDPSGELHGLCFNLIDHYDAAGETMMLKSLARKQGSPYKGIGAFLSGLSIEFANKNGYKRMLHAMMIKDNASVAISKHYSGSDYKSYSLYGLEL